MLSYCSKKLDVKTLLSLVNCCSCILLLYANNLANCSHMLLAPICCYSTLFLHAARVCYSCMLLLYTALACCFCTLFWMLLLCAVPVRCSCMPYATLVCCSCMLLLYAASVHYSECYSCMLFQYVVLVCCSCRPKLHAAPVSCWFMLFLYHLLAPTNKSCKTCYNL